ncbi:MAG: serine--tRNA ligase, partial [Candidatus Omnitrophota bacterium]
MLDLKFIRENSDRVRKALLDRQLSLDLDGLLKLDEERRLLLTRLDELRNKKNLANDEITKAIKEKQNPQEIIKRMKFIAEEIDGLGGELKEAEARLNTLLMAIPNIPHSSVPVGGPTAKQVVREWGRPKHFAFSPRTHM